MTPVEFMHIFSEFRAPSWNGWRSILARLGLGVREFYAIVGRGAGKSRIVAVLACAFASRAYHLAPGENVYVGIFAPDRKQVAITYRYVVGLLKSVPALAALIVDESKIRSNCRTASRSRSSRPASRHRVAGRIRWQSSKRRPSYRPTRTRILTLSC